MRHSLLRILLAVLVGAAFMSPAIALAQSGIAGTVTDATGSVLPGVTVEAASPALIERVRNVVTDGQGQFRLVDLRPGTYTVTFTLTGFTTVVRQNVALESSFTATVDAQLRVGTVEESIIVSGAAPLVDVQSTSRRAVVSSDMVQQIPNGRSITMVGATMPALLEGGANKDVGGLRGMQQLPTPLTAYGSRDMTLEIDGLNVTYPIGNGLPGVYHDVGAYQDFVYQTSGSTSEAQTGGVRLNMISKAGSNRYDGSALWLWSAPGLYTNNIDADLRARGITDPPKLVRMRDFNADAGGPIRNDRLWFYLSARLWDVDNAVNMVHDGRLAPAGEQVVDDNSLQAYMLRLTQQVTQRDKISAAFALFPRERKLNGIESLTTRPEATHDYVAPASNLFTVKWTSAVSNRLLLEGGIAPIRHTVRGLAQPGTKTPAERPPYGDIRKCDISRNLCSNAVTSVFDTKSMKTSYAASVAYVTGSHNLKVGYQYSHSLNADVRVANGDGAQLYNNGVAFAFDAANTPINNAETDVDEQGVFIQDTWTFQRLTLNPGLRWDTFVGSIPAQTMGAGRFVTERSFAPVDDIPNWKDVAPRFGAAYDIRGNGRTAIKGSAGKYLLMQSVGVPAQFNPARPGSLFTPTYDRRNWTDVNGDDIAQDSEIAASRNPTFARADRNPGPGLEREYDLLYNISLEHELWSGFGMSVAFNRRDARNLTWIDNVNQVPADYEMLTSPDPRNPSVQIPVWQIIPARLAPAVKELIVNSDDNRRSYTGFDVLFSSRLQGGGLLSGGLSSGHLVRVNCDRENPGGDSRFCDESQFDIPYRTTFKFAGSYPLPWFGLRVSGTFQSIPGDERNWTYNVTRTQVPALSTVSSVGLRLNEPGSEYFKRIKQTDINFSGNLRAGKVRVRPTLDIFNVFNVAPILTELGTYPNQERPRTVLAGRVVRFSFQFPYGR